ncbi:p53 inducible protein [Thraustotheca clavata]|uniref:p53 inducible protein n=1 Tax=Thraustotheca clavata TaxID=74557 RepID=A0A1W0A7M1_9STRA|nr:p53 inducible protein [Thraustotheca clavata]
MAEELKICLPKADFDANFIAKCALNSTFEDEMNLVTQLQLVCQKGTKIFLELYTFRSCARALPNVIDSKAQEAIFEVLRPHMRKLKVLNEFALNTTVLISSNIQKLTIQDNCTKVIPDILLSSFIDVIDVLVKLNQLNDIKSGLRNDFSVAFQHVQDSLQDAAIVSNDIQSLQEFLGSSTHPKGFVFNLLRYNIHNVKHFEQVLCLMLKHILSHLDHQLYVGSEDKHKLLRVIPYLLLILDKDGNGKANTFKGNKKKLNNIVKVLRRYPVVPTYADMTLNPSSILADSSFSSLISPADTLPSNFDLAALHNQIHTDYDKYLLRLASQDTQKPELLYNVVLDGIILLSEWKSSLLQYIAWKYQHSVSNDRLARLGANLSAPSVEYERVTKYNYSVQEWTALIDVIRCIKSLVATLQQTFSQAHIFKSLQQAIYQKVQIYCQHSLLPVLHHADKKKHAALKSLIELRNLAADWVKFDPNDYKLGRSDRTLSEINNRSVGPTHSQLQKLRTHTQALFDKRGTMKASWGILSGNIDSDITVLKSFYYESFFYAKILHVDSILDDISDCSDLWFREFYLELTKCIQFPIEISMPWMLMEHVLTKPSIGYDSLLFLLDIYNDAADRSLRTLEQQFLYDEVEAEANLCFEQLVFLLSDRVYMHFKNIGASSLLENSFNTVSLLKKFEYVLRQNHISVLGRYIDLNQLITDHVLASITKDLETSIHRLETGNLTLLVELDWQLRVLEATHNALTKYLNLPSFQELQKEVYENRLVSIIEAELINNMLPQYELSWNLMEFRCPEEPNDVKYDNQLFGSQFRSAFEQRLRPFRGVFGQQHLLSMLRLHSKCEICSIVSSLTKSLEDKVHDVLPLCINALISAIPPCKLPKFLYKTEGCFGYFEGKLKPVLDDEDLKSHIFQCFRMVGNTLALIYFMNEVIAGQTLFDSKVTSAFALKNIPLDMFSCALQSLEKKLTSSGFIERWNSSNYAGGYGHAWSALEFIICCHEQIGDGIGIAGTTVIHFLNQRHMSSLLSFTHHVLSVHASESSPSEASALATRAASFIATASRRKHLSLLWYDILEY